jgi:osmotically-inducible protein OsmY
MSRLRLETISDELLNHSDELLNQKVGKSIRQLNYRQLHEIECRSKNGVVTLAGTLASFYFKQMAQAIAAKVPGVTRIVNEIQVVS